ncbi:MAG: Hpt domain-containing protein [Anaerolineae bacterium]|nr:Hpt domain-containing protein [Phycisphaerae bacterium]
MSDASSSDTDPVMLELFRAEVDIHLPALSRGLLALEKGQADAKEIDSMMRAAHSIKGAARIVGNDPAVRVAHVMEDCFTLAKDARVTLSSDSVDILLDGVDALQRICTPDSDVTEEFIQSVLDRIVALRDGKPTAAPVNAVQVPVTTPSASSVKLPADFDDAAAELIRRQLCGIVARTPACIRFDFAEVKHVSVTAMSLLMSFARDMTEKLPSSVLEAHRVAPPIRALFRVVGLDNAFVVKD